MELIMLRISILLLFWLTKCFLLENGDVTVEDRYVVVDGILVDKMDLMQAQFEQKTISDEANLKAKRDDEEAMLYNESVEFTKNLPNKCQVCRLMVTEIQRKLKSFGALKARTKQGKAIYYKDDMVLWHVFDELCNEMTKYNIDKKTPFRYRKGVTSYLRRKADEMTKHAKGIQWFWNIDEADIDDPTGEIRRLLKQCTEMVVDNQDHIRRWFYTSQNSDPLKWLCAKRILKPTDSHGCLWIQDNNLDDLTNFDKTHHNEEIKEDKKCHDKTNHEEL